MNVEIIRRRTRTVETLPVAFGHGFVVFNPIVTEPTRGRDAVGSRRIALLEHERYLRIDYRDRTRHDRRRHDRATVRGGAL